MEAPTTCCEERLWWETIISDLYEAKCKKCGKMYLRKGMSCYIKESGEAKYKCPECGAEIVEKSLPHPVRPGYRVPAYYCPNCEEEPQA
ncbi:MAG: hypothetical protein ACE5K4_00260 [Candidatus Hydrothermarchaeota archaeon]